MFFKFNILIISKLVSSNNNTKKKYFNLISNFKMSSIANRKYKIAICQLTCKDDKNENFSICKNLIAEAKQQGAKVN